MGFGRFAAEAGVFQDLLRADAVDVVRPDLARHGITQCAPDLRRRRTVLCRRRSVSRRRPDRNRGGAASCRQPSEFLHPADTVPGGRRGPPHASAPRGRRHGKRQGRIPATSATDRGLGITVNEAAFTEYREREAMNRRHFLSGAGGTLAAGKLAGAPARRPSLSFCDCALQPQAAVPVGAGALARRSDRKSGLRTSRPSA